MCYASRMIVFTDWSSVYGGGGLNGPAPVHHGIFVSNGVLIATGVAFVACILWASMVGYFVGSKRART